MLRGFEADLNRQKKNKVANWKTEQLKLTGLRSRRKKNKQQ